MKGQDKRGLTPVSARGTGLLFETMDMYRTGSCALGHVKISYPTLNRNQVIERLRQDRASLQKKLPISKMILYGSYSQDRYTAGSDIDIIIVYEGKERNDAFKLVIEKLNLPRLEPKVFTEEQFRVMIAQSPKFAETLRKEGTTI